MLRVGISGLAIKIFDLHLVEYQQGQTEKCFFLKLLPKGILLLWLLLFEQAVYFLWNAEGLGTGTVRGLDPSAVIFGVLGAVSGGR